MVRFILNRRSNYDYMTTWYIQTDFKSKSYRTPQEKPQKDAEETHDENRRNTAPTPLVLTLQGRCLCFVCLENAI